MAYAKNVAEFYSLYNEPVSKAVEYVMQQMITKYKELINQIVYAHIPEEYERTYEFLESWQTNSQKTVKVGLGFYLKTLLLCLIIQKCFNMAVYILLMVMLGMN